MIKTRIPKATQLQTTVTDEQIEQFAAGADITSSSIKESVNPKAKRNYKSICVPFNEHEFNELERLCVATGRSRLSLIRYAIAQLGKV